MRKMKLGTVCLLLVCSMALGARSVSNLSLGGIGAYHFPGSGDYFSQMQSVDNWQVGGSLSFRLSVVQLEVMFLPSSYDDATTQLSTLMLAGVSIPLSSVSSLEFGMGPAIKILIPKSGNDDSSLSYLLEDGSIASSSTDFGTLFTCSQLFWKAGLSVKLGNFGLHTSYLCPTDLTFHSLFSQPKAQDFFLFDEGSLCVALTFDLY